MRPVSVGRNLVPNVKTTMFTIPTKHDGLWNLLHAYNGTASAKNFTVWWYDKSQNVEVAIITDYPLAAKSYLQFGGDGKYVVLEEGDCVVYQGNKLNHWRDHFEGTDYYQLFMHYVEAEGQYKDKIFDSRPYFGLPGSTKRDYGHTNNK